MRKLRNTEVKQLPKGTNLVVEEWNPGILAPEPMFLTTMLECCISPLGFLYQERMGENEEGWEIYRIPNAHRTVYEPLFKVEWLRKTQKLQKFSKDGEEKVEIYSSTGLKYKITDLINTLLSHKVPSFFLE